LSVRYDRVTIRMEYTEDFSSPAPGRPGADHITWAFVVTPDKLDRIRTLVAWNHEDTPKDMTGYMGL